MADFNILSGEGIGGIPPIYLIGGAAIIGGIYLWRKSSASSSANAANPGQGTQFSSSNTTTNPTTGDTSTYTASGNGYLPGMLTYGASPMPYSLGDIYVNTNLSSPNTPSPTPAPTGNLNLPDIYTSSGRDEGQYRFGQDEINYIQQNMGKFGFSPQILNDVQNTYNKMVSSVGADAANTYHYAWFGPGNVQVVPEYSSNGTPLYPQSTNQTIPTGINTTTPQAGTSQAPAAQVPTYAQGPVATGAPGGIVSAR